MRTLERTKIGVVIPANLEPIPFGYLLQVVSFIGTNPIKKAYLMDGNQYRRFPTRGEAVDYAVEHMDCGQVIFSNLKNDRCSIIAHVTDSLFYNVPPTDYMLVAD